MGNKTKESAYARPVLIRGFRAVICRAAARAGIRRRLAGLCGFRIATTAPHPRMEE